MSTDHYSDEIYAIKEVTVAIEELKDVLERIAVAVEKFHEQKYPYVNDNGQFVIDKVDGKEIYKK